jgi:hypothetical protein
MFELNKLFILFVVIVYFAIFLILSLSNFPKFRLKAKNLYTNITRYLKNIQYSELVFEFVKNKIAEPVYRFFKLVFKYIKFISAKILIAEQFIVNFISPVMSEYANIPSLLIRKFYALGINYIIIIFFGYLLLIYFILTLK